jgi:hypothetical protein
VQPAAVTGDRALKAKHLGELSVLGKGFLSEGGRFRCDARRVPPAGPGPRVQPNRCPRARGLSGKRRGAALWSPRICRTGVPRQLRFPARRCAAACGGDLHLQLAGAWT